jgi:hypothetical protein
LHSPLLVAFFGHQLFYLNDFPTVSNDAGRGTILAVTKK